MKKLRSLIFPLIFMIVLSGCSGLNPQKSSSVPSESESEIPSSEKATYRVRWLNSDGSVLEVDENVPEGEQPVYNGDTPSLEANGSLYVYLLLGGRLNECQFLVIKNIQQHTNQLPTHIQLHG